MEEPTTFQEVYDFFLSGITDDMFLEMTKEDTQEMLQEILVAAFPHYEFPQWKNPFDLDMVKKEFTAKLTLEDMRILRSYMIVQWIGFQLANVDLVRQKYSGSDFSFTSQAAHMKQLIAMKQEYEREGFHLQRLQGRRYVDAEGHIRSSLSKIMEPL